MGFWDVWGYLIMGRVDHQYVWLVIVHPNDSSSSLIWLILFEYIFFNRCMVSSSCLSLSLYIHTHTWFFYIDVGFQSASSWLVFWFFLLPSCRRRGQQWWGEVLTIIDVLFFSVRCSTPILPMTFLLLKYSRQCGEDSGRQGSSALFTDQLMGWLESVSVVTETKYRHVYGHDGTHAGWYCN